MKDIVDPRNSHVGIKTTIIELKFTAVTDLGIFPYCPPRPRRSDPRSVDFKTVCCINENRLIGPHTCVKKYRGKKQAHRKTRWVRRGVFSLPSLARAWHWAAFPWLPSTSLDIGGPVLGKHRQDFFPFSFHFPFPKVQQGPAIAQPGLKPRGARSRSKKEVLLTVQWQLQGLAIRHCLQIAFF